MISNPCAMLMPRPTRTGSALVGSSALAAANANAGSSLSTVPRGFSLSSISVLIELLFEMVWQFHCGQTQTARKGLTEPFVGDPMVQERRVFESRHRLSTKRATGRLLMSAFHPFRTLDDARQMLAKCRDRRLRSRPCARRLRQSHMPGLD